MIRCKGCGLLSCGIDGFCSCCLEAQGGHRSLREAAERIYLAQLDNRMRAQVQAIQATLRDPATTLNIEGLRGGQR